MTCAQEPFDNIIRNCSQKTIQELIDLRDQGVPNKVLISRSGYNQTQLRRYLRVYDRYGVEAFIEDELLAL